MMRRIGVLLFGLLALLTTGCGDPSHRARYEAERARYWAEREEIRFSLQANPKVRESHYTTALRYLEMAQLADPRRQTAGLDGAVLADLLELHGYARLRSGSSFLRSGRFDLADAQLAIAQERGAPRFQEQAAALRGQAALEQEDRETALRRYTELFELVLAPSRQEAPQLSHLEIPAGFAEELIAAEDSTRLTAWCGYAREKLEEVARRWPEDPRARRALFLRHRLDLMLEDWDLALDALDRYEASDPLEEDRSRARFDRAEILRRGYRDFDGARTIYRDVAESSTDRRLQGLARLRLADMLMRENELDDARAALEGIVNEFSDEPGVASSAETLRADILRRLGRSGELLQSLRRVTIRFSDTTAGLAAPLQIVEIYRARGEQSQINAALSRAAADFRRVIAAHASDTVVGVRARRNLVRCLLMQGEAVEALRELDQLYHILGASRSGMDALLEAARIAEVELNDPDLARRYLEKVVEQLPSSRSALRAERRLAELPS